MKFFYFPKALNKTLIKLDEVKLTRLADFTSEDPNLCRYLIIITTDLGVERIEFIDLEVRDKSFENMMRYIEEEETHIGNGKVILNCNNPDL